MLDAAIQQQIASYLDRLQGPVELVATLDDSAKAAEMREFLTTLASLSERVSLRTDGAATRAPSFTVGRPGETARIAFAGIPMGHEFTSLILAVLQAGGHPPKVEAEVVEQITALAGATGEKFDFEVYISLSCHNCPDVVQALNLMAVLNPAVRCTMVDGALYQDEVAARQIMAVPTVLLNGAPFGQGRMTIEEIVAKLDVRRRSARGGEDQCSGAVRRARRRRRPGRRGGGDLRRAEGHPYRRRRRAFRRSGARHAGDRELHLGESHRRPEARCRARAARPRLRRRRDQLAARRGPDPGYRRRLPRAAYGQRRGAARAQRHHRHRRALA
jgi:hypothetical protein